MTTEYDECGALGYIFPARAAKDREDPRQIGVRGGRAAAPACRKIPPLCH
jgi:hypothetical protein